LNDFTHPCSRTSCARGLKRSVVRMVWWQNDAWRQFDTTDVWCYIGCSKIIAAYRQRRAHHERDSRKRADHRKGLEHSGRNIELGGRIDGDYLEQFRRTGRARKSAENRGPGEP